MQRSRGSEVPQRQSQRVPFQLRTSTSDSDLPHRRPVVDRSPKLGDRRSPRGSQSDPLNQKKKNLGTRVSELESHLGQAQEELKKLKEQLASSEVAKKEAQEELKKSKKLIIPDPPEEERHHTTEVHESNDKISTTPGGNQPETDVFEVPVPTLPVDPVVEPSPMTEKEENETNRIEKIIEPPPMPEPNKTPLDDFALENAEINLLNAKLEEKEKELKVFCEENESLKQHITKVTAEATSAQTKQDETTLKLRQLGEELETSKANEAQLNQQLEAVEGVKIALEMEMKKLRVQSEQWRKAADAAAAVLAGGMEMNGRVAERCGGSMVSGGSFEAAGGCPGLLGSPMMGDALDDGFGNGKRKGPGIRMFVDLWKKKGLK